MAISEQQLETWSHLGSIAQSQATFESIRGELLKTSAKYPLDSVEVFLQGSYGNGTNIYADSDVDIVILFNSVFYHDLTNLTEAERLLFEQSTSAGNYNFDEFRKDVITQLVSRYGEAVNTSGSKAIKIFGTQGRRDCDVLPAVQHRSYIRYQSSYDSNWHEGICFWDKSGNKIINYPRMHSENCNNKDLATSSLFKQSARIFKNMRNSMIGRKKLSSEVAPSYYIEGMLYNVPNVCFSFSRVDTVVNILNWLLECNRRDLVCANEKYYLLRDNSEVCWSNHDFEKYLNAAISFWNDNDL